LCLGRVTPSIVSRESRGRLCLESHPFNCVFESHVVRLRLESHPFDRLLRVTSSDCFSGVTSSDYVSKVDCLLRVTPSDCLLRIASSKSHFVRLFLERHFDCSSDCFSGVTSSDCLLRVASSDCFFVRLYLESHGFDRGLRVSRESHVRDCCLERGLSPNPFVHVAFDTGFDGSRMHLLG
jgi:hypothetical protein